MNVPFLDLKAQYHTIKKEIDRAVAEVIAEQYFILGPKVAALETAIAEYSCTRHGIGVASGSDALTLVLLAMDIGPGADVITTPFTFFATAGSISETRATPRFVDIDPETYNIDPAQIEKAITPRTKAIMPVHLFGQCADMDPIIETARRKNLFVIEDAAQAIGADYVRGGVAKRAGGIGDIGCFSFYPSKNLGAFGDGGMVVSNNDQLAERVRLLRVHGATAKYYHRYIGVNSRLDALQAAVLLVKLRHLDEWSDMRRLNAERYDRLFAAANREGLNIVTPRVQYTNRHIYNQYVIRAPQRDGLRGFLSKHGVGTDIYYPLPLHLQECYRTLGYHKGDFPESERAAEETLALPIFPELGEDQQEYVVEKIKEFYLNGPA